MNECCLLFTNIYRLNSRQDNGIHPSRMWYANNNSSEETELEILIKLAWEQSICSMCTDVLYKYNADVHRTEAIRFLVGFRSQHASYFFILGRNGPPKSLLLL